MEKIPKPTVKRLGLYYRCLEKLLEEDKHYTSSKEIAEKVGVKPSQVRKDLSYFGEFGKRGVGYPIKELLEKLKELLGIEREWKTVVVGAGNLGKAVAGYKGLKMHGFEVVGLFDVDKRKIGTTVHGVKVLPMEKLKSFVKKNNVKIGIICVPREAAQEVVEKLEEAGVQGILNFAPRVLKTELPVEHIDITLSLKALTFQMIRRKKKSERSKKSRRS